MILVIDNYDSFTYNLVQYLGEMGHELSVHRNDQITLDRAAELDPDYIVISPGPGTPDVAGISLEIIKRFTGEKPILGVCLGHQGVGAAFGGAIVRASRIMHGKSSRIFHHGKDIFAGIPSPFSAIRYHSLVIAPDTMPECLEVTAKTEMGEIMGVKHREYPVFGIQFHPESIMTEYGKEILNNFLQTKGGDHD